MTFKEAMAELKKAGTAQNVKIYRKHGAQGELYGVSFAELGKLAKKIKTDHNLAVELWESGNVDARILATMIADPDKLTAAQADRWVKDVDYYVLGDSLASLVARSAIGPGRIKKWSKAKAEFVRSTGYAALASALKDADGIGDADCEAYLSTIEKGIAGSANRARHSMNGALIAIGVFRPHLAEKAMAAAVKIGRVEVDHGQTSCKTPDAVSYIKRALQRRA